MQVNPKSITLTFSNYIVKREVVVTHFDDNETSHKVSHLTLPSIENLHKKLEAYLDTSHIPDVKSVDAILFSVYENYEGFHLAVSTGEYDMSQKTILYEE